MKNYKNPSNSFGYENLRENPPKFWNVRKPPKEELQEYARKYSISEIAYFYRTYNQVVQGWLEEDGIYHVELPESSGIIPPVATGDVARKELLKKLKPVNETILRVIRPSADQEESLEPDTIFPPTVRRPDVKGVLEEEAREREAEGEDEIETDEASDLDLGRKKSNIRRVETGETWEKPKIKALSPESVFPPTGSLSPTDESTARLLAKIIRTPYEDRVYTDVIANISIKDMLKSPEEFAERLADVGSTMDVYKSDSRFANDEVYKELCRLLFVEKMTTVDIARAWDVPYEQIKNLCKRYKISTRIYPTCGEYAADHATMTYPDLAKKYGITRITATNWAKACGLRREQTSFLEIYKDVLPNIFKDYHEGVEKAEILSKYGIPAESTLKWLLISYNATVDPADRIKRKFRRETVAKPRQANLKDLKKELDTYPDEKLKDLLEQHLTIKGLSEYLGATKAFLGKYLANRNIQADRKKKYPYNPKVEELYIDNIKNVEEMFEAFTTDEAFNDLEMISDKSAITYLLGYFKERSYVELVDVTPENNFGILSVDYRGYAGTVGLVRCPAGRFEMGVNLEDVGYDPKFVASSPKHTVELTRDFWISETEVTQDLWEAVMGWNESQVKGPKLPVTNVSHDDALVFCLKLNRLLTGRSGLILKTFDTARIGNHYNLSARSKSPNPNNMNTMISLPTSAEWEYAAASGGRDARHPGSLTVFSSYGWCRDNTSSVQKVGLKAPNYWGLYDTLGNVNEWCFDAFDPEGYKNLRDSVTVDPESKATIKMRLDKYSSPQKRINPVKIVRGGSVAEGFDACHVALVKGQKNDEFNATTGFRFVLYLGE